MALQYEHSTRPDPDGLRPAPRTLRDAVRDPLDWIELPHQARAANAALLVDGDESSARPALTIDRRTLAAAVVIALVVLLIIGGVAVSLRAIGP